jgi:hypothetical protein
LEQSIYFHASREDREAAVCTATIASSSAFGIPKRIIVNHVLAEFSKPL